MPYFDNAGTLPTYSAGLAVASNFSRVQISAGIGFFSTGCSSTGGFTLLDPYGNPLGTSYGTYRFRFLHIGIPFTVGLYAPISNRFGIIYSLGIMPAYNNAAHTSFTPGPAGYKSQTVSKEYFDTYYSRFTVFGIARVRFQYKLPRGLKIFAGPAFRPMITSILKSSPMLREREYALTFDAGAGILIHAARRKK